MAIEQKTERVVVLFSEEELTELENAIKVASKMKGQRNPKLSAFLRDVLLSWSDEVRKSSDCNQKEDVSPGERNQLSLSI